MDVSGYQLSTRYASLLARVNEIADQAARLVEQRMRERMVPTRIIVAAERHCPEAVIRVQQQVLGVASLPLRAERVDYLGITTLARDGAVIVLNANPLAGDTRMTDETVVHELVHAVQFSRPGSRELAMKGLRNNYGVEKLTLTRAWKTNRGIDKDEREAAALEYLAREIR